MEEQYNCFSKNQVCEFIILFLRQFFDIGNSAGSIISEAVGFIKTFQRLSAPKTFSARFSSECLEMFDWASKIIQNITINISDGIPLYDFEAFLIYVLAIPLTILIFISRVQVTFFCFQVWTYGIAIMLGSGIGFCQISLSKMLGLTIPSVILSIATFLYIRNIGLSSIFCNKEKVENEFNEEEEEESPVAHDILIPFTLAFDLGILIFIGIASPVLQLRPRLANILVIIFAIAMVVILSFEIIDRCCSKNYVLHSKMILGKLLFFFVNLFSILIIPCTNSFGKIMIGEFKNQWQCIIGYIVLGLILPIGLNFVLIYYDYPDICDKYKRREYGINLYKYIELIDIVRQVAYALSALFDCTWACIAIEIAWCIFVLAIRPYINLSDYFLTVGNSLVIFVGNVIAICMEKENKFFSFEAAVGFFIAACIPAIISIYVFFFLEFQTKLDPCIFKLSKIPDDELESDLLAIKNKYIGESFDKLSTVFKIITPIAWCIFSLNIPIIESNNLFYDNE